MRTGVVIRLAIALLCAGVARDGWGAGLAIQSFNGSGRLTFNELMTATTYRVEWALAPTGAWHKGSPGTTTDIVARGYGQSAATVSMDMSNCFFRLVAVVTNAPPGMALIPAGDFVMGAETNVGHEYYVGETNQHTVYVNAFYMDRCELTKAKWDEVRAWGLTNGYTDLPAGGGKGANHPVQSNTWYDVVKWCNARSQMEGRPPCYTNANGTVYNQGSLTGDCNWAASGYRLPTEAEWEKAARGGVANHRFPWSDSDEIQHARATYYSSASYPYDTSPTRNVNPAYIDDGTWPNTSPGGSFAPNGYGIYDMAGNVYEWCWDWYSSSYYNNSPGSNPVGPSVGTNRVVRGGSWIAQAFCCRVAWRIYMAPDSTSYNVGFRVVLPMAL